MGSPDSTLTAPIDAVDRGSLRAAFRGIRSAPWQPAVPLLLVAAAVLWVGLMVADEGGWREVFPDGERWRVYTYIDGDTSFFTGQPWDFLSVNGAKVILALSALLAGLALAGRRWATVAVVPVIAVGFAGWIGDTGRLDYVTVQLAKPDPSTGIGLETAITVYGVIGLLLAVAMLTALTWAISGTRATRRQAADTVVDGPPARRSTRESAAILGGATILTLAMPRLAIWIRDAMESVLGTSIPSANIQMMEPIEASALDRYANHTVWLLIAAIVVIVIGSLVLPRRAPAVAVAFTLLAIALIIPASWMLGPVFDEVLPLGWLIDRGGALGFWFLAFALGLTIATWSFARAGRATAPHARNAPTQVERDRADHPA